MCLIGLALDAHPRFPLVIAANRDEFRSRPTQALHWWADRPPGAVPVLGGRDLQAGGGWMLLSPQGRLALLTNVRAPASQRPEARSRGELPLGWLDHPAKAEAWAAAHPPAAHNGHNLLLGELDPTGHGAGRWHALQAGHGAFAPGLQALGPGLHGVSNAALDTPWPKLRKLKAAIGQALAATPQRTAEDRPDDGPADRLARQLFAALADPRPADPAELPATGVSPAWERWLSPCFIRTPDGRYGTLSSSVLLLERRAAGSRLLWIERSHAAEAGAPARERRITLPWPPGPGALPAVEDGAEAAAA
ncbi:NRDE family protein [Aquariibacter albus]|uniref:NRDE family protein n=1 Tax=Aquariibacter albus TaxID=2759899 RepID=A0A839HPX8_9BURK|nr:NRDE family protein [Aquariibacter albus]MBB1161071.1 NRDE family protein [Aquariibacter albus]